MCENDGDGDGIPDDCDDCDGNLENTSCDDGDPCTVNDVYDANCDCAGEFVDTDNDGIADVCETNPCNDCTSGQTLVCHYPPNNPEHPRTISLNCLVLNSFFDIYPNDYCGPCQDTNECPNDPDKSEPGACGCGVPDTDTDGDGVPDCLDECPNDRFKVNPGVCGCNKKDTDTDGDGVADCNEDYSEYDCPCDENGKAIICHYIGNSNIRKVMAVDCESVGYHIAHNERDYCGPCQEVVSEEEEEENVECYNIASCTAPVASTKCGNLISENDCEPTLVVTYNNCYQVDLCSSEEFEYIYVLYKDSVIVEKDYEVLELHTNEDSLFSSTEMLGIWVKAGCINSTNEELCEDCGYYYPNPNIENCVIDSCPDNDAKIVPGECGCDEIDIDSDGDGVYDCDDECPFNSRKIAPGACGCDEVDIDSDGDCVYDCEDECPYNRMKSIAGICGCDELDIDSDGDGVNDCEDECPTNTLIQRLEDGQDCKDQLHEVIKTKSNVAKRLSKNNGLTKMVIAPNPVNSKLNLKLLNMDKGKIDTQIFSAEGKLLITKSFNINTETHDQSISTKGLTNGFYYLIVLDKDNYMYKKSFVVEQ